MRRTSYDIEAACAAIQNQPDYPDVAEWTDYFLHFRASDADALGAFPPPRRPSRMITGVRNSAWMPRLIVDRYLRNSGLIGGTATPDNGCRDSWGT
jgi:hypothetical protein